MSGWPSFILDSISPLHNRTRLQRQFIVMDEDAADTRARASVEAIFQRYFKLAEANARDVSLLHNRQTVLACLLCHLVLIPTLP